MKMSQLSHQGLVRINNEDAIQCDADLGVAVLADGMGGLLAGEEASGVAVHNSIELLQTAAQADTAPVVSEVLLSAHAAVVEHAHEKNYSGKMGTTLLLWSWCMGTPAFAHVGDSRLYHHDAHGLTQLTRDQTVAQRMIDSGEYPNLDPRRVPNRNVLTQAVGMPGRLQPESGITPAHGRLLLCSDGLSDLVRDEAIAELMAVADLDDCARQLVKAALDAGGRDNVSVILIDFD